VVVSTYFNLDSAHGVHVVISSSRNSITLFSGFFNYIQSRNLSPDRSQKLHLLIVPSQLFLSSHRQFSHGGGQFILDTDVVHSFQFGFGQFDVGSHSFGDVNGDEVAEVRSGVDHVVHCEDRLD